MPRPDLELLAPARDADIGIDAVNGGADAVYIGGPALGARKKAGHSIRDIARLVQQAHRHRARIFVTHNTLLRDDQLEGARRLAWDLHDPGVDALIVQDMGLLQLDLQPSKPCEMRAVGKIRKNVLRQAAAVPMQVHRTRPAQRG